MDASLYIQLLECHSRGELMKNHRNERLCDGLAFRATPSQRRFIETLSEERGITICEGIRIIIDEAMAKEGVVAC
jgi:hypothetical protein